MRSFKVLLAMLIWVPTLTAASARADDFTDWYGTVRFTKTLSSGSTETYTPGHDFYPGTKVVSESTTWSGTARFVPGRKLWINAHYHRKKSDNRRTERSGPCPWKDGPSAYHDYELNESESTVEVNREWPNSHLNFYIHDDGNYETSFIASGGNQTPDALYVHTRREFFTECSIPHLSINDQEMKTSDGMEAISFDHIAGAAEEGAPKLSGSWTGKDDDGGDLSYSWELTRAAPALVARIQATPNVVDRAAQVTLSATSSLGAIKSYEWEFTPEGEDCQMTPAGMQAKFTGAKLTFTALCDFTAHLKISNEQTSDSTTLFVSVAPRKGWKTTFRTRPGPNFTARVFADEIRFGVNQCSLHASDNTTGHMIHTDAENNRTWRDGGYKLAQVQDAGPFQGVWYVDTQSLKIDRLERINSAMLAGGEVYQLNQRHGSTRDLDALIAQIKAHEAAHSTLISEKLAQLGAEGDPARRIEKIVGAAGEEAFQFLVDYHVRDVETVLWEATSDEQVKNRLRGAGLTRAVKIWFPTRPEVSGGASGELLKDLGPLWSVGD